MARLYKVYECYYSDGAVMRTGGKTKKKTIPSFQEYEKYYGKMLKVKLVKKITHLEWLKWKNK